jgi:hypothetical protein
MRAVLVISLQTSWQIACKRFFGNRLVFGRRVWGGCLPNGGREDHFLILFVFQSGEFLKDKNIRNNNDGNPKTTVMWDLRFSAFDAVSEDLVFRSNVQYVPCIVRVFRSNVYSTFLISVITAAMRGQGYCARWDVKNALPLISGVWSKGYPFFIIWKEDVATSWQQDLTGSVRMSVGWESELVTSVSDTCRPVRCLLWEWVKWLSVL